MDMTNRIFKWLAEIVEEKGKNPNEVLRTDVIEGGVTLWATLLSGDVGEVSVFPSADYLVLACPNAYRGFQPLDEADWLRSCSEYELFGNCFPGTTKSGEHLGMACLRIKPQSADELRLDLQTFLARVHLAVETFTKATSANPSGTAPG